MPFPRASEDSVEYLDRAPAAEESFGKERERGPATTTQRYRAVCFLDRTACYLLH